MATTRDDSTDAQAATKDAKAPIQARVQQGVRDALSAPFRLTAAFAVKAHEVNETAGLMAYNGVQYAVAFLIARIANKAGSLMLHGLLNSLYDEGDKISKRRLNGYTLLTYGVAYAVAVVVGLYVDAKFQQEFHEQRSEQLMTNILLDEEEDDD